MNEIVNRRRTNGKLINAAFQLALVIVLIVMTTIHFVEKNKLEMTIESLKSEVSQSTKANAAEKKIADAEIYNLKDTLSALKKSNGRLADESVRLKNENSVLRGIAVVVMPTGEKYHATGCRHINANGYFMIRTDAEWEGYSPCLVCF